MSGLVGAVWLAKKEMKGGWLSYLLTLLFVAFMGLFGVASVSGIFELEGFGAWGQRMEDYCNAFFLDYLFLTVCALLGVYTVFRGQAPLLHTSWDFWREIPTSRKLLILRGLPVPTGSLVGSRLISIIFALMGNAVAFFVPVFLLSDLRELGTSYLWFAGIWIGYALATSGLYLLCELTLRSDRVHTLFSLSLATSLIVVVLLIEWMLEPSLVEQTAKLAQSHYGALLAILSILVGGAALTLFSRLTARRIEKRDLSRSLTKDFSSRKVAL